MLFSKTSRKAKFLAVAALTVVSALASTTPASARLGIYKSTNVQANYAFFDPTAGSRFTVRFDACTTVDGIAFNRYANTSTSCAKAIVESIEVSFSVPTSTGWAAAAPSIKTAGKIYKNTGLWSPTTALPVRVCSNVKVVVTARYSLNGVIHSVSDVIKGDVRLGTYCKLL